jgi:4-hydroxy-L-threonine phosphate dehydrogenase PdxA
VLDSSSSNQKPLNIGFTLGDPAGIGPEIFFKFQQNFQNNPNFNILLIDDLKAYNQVLSKIKLGQPSGFCGEHCYHSLKKADFLFRQNQIDYLVTGPVSKESLWMAGLNFSGQTELLASINQLNSDDIEMFFVLDDFRVVLATRHISINQVSDNLKKRLPRVLDNATNAMQSIFKIPKPKIAVAGLNPHAGENGIIGKEETEFMSRMLNHFSTKQIADVNGPFSADALFARAAQNYLNNRIQEYDLFVAAYHDQILPLIKGLGGFRAVNLTAGLPYLRLSVDHGTGFDIAGQNIASCEGLLACTQLILKISHREKAKFA